MYIFILSVLIIFLNSNILYAQRGILLNAEGANWLNSDAYQVNLNLFYNDRDITNEVWSDDITVVEDKFKQHQEIDLRYCNLGINLSKIPDEKIKVYPQFTLFSASVYFNMNSTSNSLHFRSKILDFNSKLPFLKEYCLFEFEPFYGYSFYKSLDEYLLTSIGIGVSGSLIEFNNTALKRKEEDILPTIQGAAPSYAFELKGIFKKMEFEAIFKDRFFIVKPILRMTQISTKISFDDRLIQEFGALGGYKTRYTSLEVYLKLDYYLISQEYKKENTAKICLGINYPPEFLNHLLFKILYPKE